MIDNNSSATPCAGDTWKSPNGTVFQTPDNKPPVHYSPITIYDGNGNSVSGRWMNNEAVKDS